MIALLTTDIGRGHPFYLDGVREALRLRGTSSVVAASASVFELARGPSALAWQAVREAYRLAGRGGAIADLYARTRRAAVPSSGSPLHLLLGAQLRPWAERFDLVLVDHPVLVGALHGHPRVWYQHGEHAAPPEAVAPAAERTFVPTQRTADTFSAAGYPRERLAVTGLCIEPLLRRRASEDHARRLERLRTGAPLRVAFFSSGAEPRGHVASLAVGAQAVAAAGHRALVVARRSGRLEAAMAATPQKGVEVVGFEGRAELDRVTAERLPGVDVFASPAHERTQWGLGLGLPMVLVGPDIGPFPPLNRAVLREAGVVIELHHAPDALALGERLHALRASSELERMAERGWGRPIEGFDRVAEALEQTKSRR